MPLKKTKIFSIVCLLAALFVVIAFWVLYSFTSGQITETITNRDALTLEIKKEDTMAFMKGDIQKGQAYQKQLSQYVISQNGIDAFLKTLDTLKASSSVTSQVNAVGYQDSSAANAISGKVIHVNISAVGSWNNVMYFLTLLENYPLKIDIQNVSLTNYATYTVSKKAVPQWNITVDFTVLAL